MPEDEDEPEELTVPEYVRRKIYAAGFDIDSIDEDPPQREYAVMRDVLATVKRMRADGATPDEIRAALGNWGELTDWAIKHPATDPEQGGEVGGQLEFVEVDHESREVRIQIDFDLDSLDLVRDAVSAVMEGLGFHVDYGGSGVTGSWTVTVQHHPDDDEDADHPDDDEDDDDEADETPPI